MVLYVIHDIIFTQIGIGRPINTVSHTEKHILSVACQNLICYNSTLMYKSDKIIIETKAFLSFR